jgi:glycosyltransferase involved in cell wall biosynthesis
LPAVLASDFHPAFIVPRYGEEVVGGAEDLARRTAEELARRGFEVSVLTTRALDHRTWRNHYPAGKTVLNGVEVNRFTAQSRLSEAAVRRALIEISSGASVSSRDQRLWLEGVVTSEDLLGHLRDQGGGYSHLIFLPYLFGTTYYGASIYPERSFIIPCLHDEPYAHLPLIKEMLKSVKGLIFNSPGEKRLASRLLEIGDPGPVVGMGFKPLTGDPSAFRDRTFVRGDFLLYAGRREEGKNTPLLVDYFRRFCVSNPGLSSLVLMGAGEVSVPPDSSHIIFDLGRVSEQEKWDGYAAASVFCQPSVNESLSIVLLESWLAGRPALVNKNCDVTLEHVVASGGGLAFGDFAEFTEALLALLEDGERAGRLGEAGRNYVTEEYNWDAVVRRLCKALGVKTGEDTPGSGSPRVR